MLGPSDEVAAFEAMKEDLLRSHPGGFAVICAGRLVGVFKSADAALTATAADLDSGALPPGAPILISEIAEPVTVRVMATPHARAAAPA